MGGCGHFTRAGRQFGSSTKILLYHTLDNFMLVMLPDPSNVDPVWPYSAIGPIYLHAPRVPLHPLLSNDHSKPTFSKVAKWLGHGSPSGQAMLFKTTTLLL